ncbi:HlyD family secretion protein [Xanthobacter agilis]|uniref:Membrane fusion protein (Multidrug efflux system) n=1 Tax=Xanthobacter agilis TaxID=47492 RepID=A0ABU0L8G9_XANAG|nr:HlyD family secretion protein [Xanthobacter agilis]MDQ0503428.1 membrane fusion protein (multidrug efflux system) [Xanthobacter agilis]
MSHTTRLDTAERDTDPTAGIALLKPLSPAAPAAQTEAPPAPKASRKRLVLGAVVGLLAAGAGWYGLHWWQVGRFEVSTDDAYVGADTSLLAAKVGGYVKSVEVEANQWVKAGDVIARIDDGDYRLAVQAASDKIATQQAALVRFDEQAKAAAAAVDQARAQLAATDADQRRTALEFERQDKLASSNFASRSALDNARADRDKAAANVLSATAAVASAEAALAVLKAQRTEAERVLAEYRTARDQAQRDLDFTVVRAPVEGVVGNRAVQVGQLVQPGTRLAAIVPLGAVYVDANFKETQFDRLHPGQKVKVHVDAYPDRDFTGQVASVSPASGAVFSLLPPENATGNFTKIVQRIPVRIGLDADAREGHALRPGMSVTAVVDTRGGDTKVAARDADAGAREKTH